ncbi:required for respiratory growth protein 9, mitochondrial [Macroventuria anomochaeta]|uniref:Required for respiratory growth protein 9, mitochondrial n=1 Tax=Macroventuria anomochaeta TaxID=301207 RepID=A0ACB6RL19_9PLEO|nr:required for respiratory growth protein 9, mitochondrial [Macroventuria anomochaeta]KAF2622655.1 required for respiratory growth protein 9, mitochondrial [Macroventuria anomochaeta]
MNCHSYPRRALSLFTRSLTDIKPSFRARQLHSKPNRPSDPFPDARPSQRPRNAPTRSPKAVATTTFDESTAEWTVGRSTRPAWQAEKEAMKKKLNGEAWNPRKKLSPDTMEGIRHLHQTQPDKFTTPVLAEHFKVSSEAIRRILKSKWQPSDEEHEERMQRWDKRGERIWSNLVEMGIKPPKKWRDMGVGRADNGDRRPVWKTRRRNQIEIRDSAPEAFLPEEDIIPTVDASGNRKTKTTIPLSDRL